MPQRGADILPLLRVPQPQQKCLRQKQMDVLNQKGGVVLTDCLPETVIAQGDPVAVLHKKWLQFPGKTVYQIQNLPVGDHVLVPAVQIPACPQKDLSVQTLLGIGQTAKEQRHCAGSIEKGVLQFPFHPGQNLTEGGKGRAAVIPAELIHQGVKGTVLPQFVQHDLHIQRIVAAFHGQQLIHLGVINVLEKTAEIGRCHHGLIPGVGHQTQPVNRQGIRQGCAGIPQAHQQRSAGRHFLGKPVVPIFTAQKLIHAIQNQQERLGAGGLSTQGGENELSFRGGVLQHIFRQ